MTMRPLVPSLLALASALPALTVPDQPVLAPVGDTALVDEGRWVQAVSRRRQRLETAPQPVVVIEERELHEQPAVSLPDRLRYVSGVDVCQSRHGQYDVGLRGYNGVLNNRLLVVVGDREFRHEEFGSPIWIGALFDSDIQRVEIAKGPSSVAYGSNAFGGVISIQERDVGDRQEVFSLVATQADGSYTGDITALGPLAGPWYFKASAGYTSLRDLPGGRGTLPIIPSPLTGGTGEDDLVAGRYALLAGVALPGEHRLEARYAGYDIGKRDMMDDLDAGVNDTSSYFDDVGVRLVGPWGRVSWLHRTAEQTYFTEKSDTLVLPPFRYTRGGFSDVEDVARAQFGGDFASHHLGVGGEFSSWRSRSNLWSTSGVYEDPSTWASITHENASAFIEDQWAISDSWQLTGALRGDHHNRYGGNWSPRVAVNWIPAPDQFVLLAYSSGYRLPTPIESNLSEYYFASDPDLNAERIQALELNWQLNRDRDLHLGLNGFFNRVDGLIWRMPLPETTMAQNFLDWAVAGDPNRPPGPFFQYQNIDQPAYAWGTEADASLRPSHLPLTIWGNVSYQILRYRDSVRIQSAGFANPGVPGLPATLFQMDNDLGRDINAPPPWKASLGLNWDEGGYQASLALRYVDHRRMFAFGNSYFLTTGQADVQDIPAYVVLDVGAGLTFGEPGRFLRISVLDLADTGHFEVPSTPTAVLDAEHEQQGANPIGRMCTLQGGWTW